MLATLEHGTRTSTTRPAAAGPGVTVYDMSDEEGRGHAQRHEVVDARLDAVEEDIGVLQERVEQGDGRASAAQVRAEDDRDRIGHLEARADVDRELIAELQAEGLISTHNAVNLAEALRTSRVIGAAIGIVMARRNVSQETAFELMKQTSMDTNTKLRVLADEVVLSGDASPLGFTEPVA